jgi:hypothetical protein
MIFYLYAIQCEQFVKIGISKDVSGRMHMLQTMVPFECKILRSTAYPGSFIREKRAVNNALLVERHLHNLLQIDDINRRGEWFDDIEKTLTKYDFFTHQFNPDLLLSRSNEFVDVGNKLWNFNITDRRKIEKALGENGKYIVERFRKYEPRHLSFLMCDHIERVRKLSGE